MIERALALALVVPLSGCVRQIVTARVRDPGGVAVAYATLTRPGALPSIVRRDPSGAIVVSCAYCRGEPAESEIVAADGTIHIHGTAAGVVAWEAGELRLTKAFEGRSGRRRAGPLRGFTLELTTPAGNVIDVRERRVVDPVLSILLGVTSFGVGALCAGLAASNQGPRAATIPLAGVFGAAGAAGVALGIYGTQRPLSDIVLQSDPR